MLQEVEIPKVGQKLIFDTDENQNISMQLGEILEFNTDTNIAKIKILSIFPVSDDIPTDKEKLHDDIVMEVKMGPCWFWDSNGVMYDFVIYNVNKYLLKFILNKTFKLSKRLVEFRQRDEKLLENVLKILDGNGFKKEELTNLMLNFAANRSIKYLNNGDKI